MRNIAESFLGVVGGLVVFALVFTWVINSSFKADNKAKALTPSPVLVSGESIWNSINAYRRDSGVNELSLNDEICANILERWKQVSSELSHKGLDEFIQSQRDTGRYSKRVIEIGEIFAGGNTTDQVMSNWKTSPGHNMAILNTKYNVGCSYYFSGVALVLLGEYK